MVTRRRLLTLGAVAVTVGVAGCADHEAEFLVTDTQRIHQPGDDRFDYPKDILYRVSIENTGSSSESGRLEMTLVYDPPDGDSRSWEKSDEISLSRGTSVQQEYVFEDVFETGNDIEEYSLEAQLLQDG